MRAILLGAQGFWTEMLTDTPLATIEIACLAPYNRDFVVSPDKGEQAWPNRLRFVRIAMSPDISDPNMWTAVYMQVPDGVKP